MTTGYWSYELCYGDHLRQFHEENGEIMMEYFLGRKTQDSHITILESGNPSITYFEGTTCDLTNEKRKTEIVFKCVDTKHSKRELVSINEGPSCVYTLVVHVKNLCKEKENDERSDAIHCITRNGEEVKTLEEKRVQKHKKSSQISEEKPITNSLMEELKTKLSGIFGNHEIVVHFAEEDEQIDIPALLRQHKDLEIQDNLQFMTEEKKNIETAQDDSLTRKESVHHGKVKEPEKKQTKIIQDGSTESLAKGHQGNPKENEKQTETIQDGSAESLAKDHQDNPKENEKQTETIQVDESMTKDSVHQDKGNQEVVTDQPKEINLKGEKEEMEPEAPKEEKKETHRGDEARMDGNEEVKVEL
eukprot:TRINITY_DN897_c0_g1_i1.p1 TRINITY_DN897_c0_g1~~TRINITY_DN897_c0_g1_i1.p1  ORF type:complete len:419 (+),score=167.90 TRINITY_DN897_c0_g1_i1:178-1257(+)